MIALEGSERNQELLRGSVADGASDGPVLRRQTQHNDLDQRGPDGMVNASTFVGGLGSKTSGMGKVSIENQWAENWVRVAH